MDGNAKSGAVLNTTLLSVSNPLGLKCLTLLRGHWAVQFQGKLLQQVIVGRIVRRGPVRKRGPGQTLAQVLEGQRHLPLFDPIRLVAIAGGV